MTYLSDLTDSSLSSIHPTELVLMMALYQPETEPHDVFVDQFCLAFAIMVTKQVNMTLPDSPTPYTFYGW